MQKVFTKLSKRAATAVGSSWAFILALLSIIVWLLTGPMFAFSDTWQLVINTGTTIVTFLMVFLIQNTQNRDSKALHLKLDEVIRSMADARNELIDLEEVPDTELDALEAEFRRLHLENGHGAGDVLDAVRAERRRRA